MRRWIWPTLWAGGIVLVVVAFLAVVQRTLIYHPLRLDAAACADLAEVQGFDEWSNAGGDAIGFRSLPDGGDQEERGSDQHDATVAEAVGQVASKPGSDGRADERDRHDEADGDVAQAEE